jgi:4'-phosphopantetheinyl transferase
MIADLARIFGALSAIAPPAELAAVPGLHIWCADLAGLAPEANGLAALLDASEHEEIRRLYHERDRLHMVLRRGVRRVVLGRHLHCAPELLHFERAAHGKPCVPGLSFSASSAPQTALLAVTRNAELGVDIEDATQFQFAAELAATCCSDREQGRLAALPEALRAAEFLRLWTAKEAVLKLRGGGFQAGVDLPGLLDHLRAGERVVALPAGPHLCASLAVAPLRTA